MCLFGFAVTVPPNIAGENTPQDVSVLQNRQVTLECKSDAVPPPTLTWLKDAQPLQVRNPPNDYKHKFAFIALTCNVLLWKRPLHVSVFCPVDATYRSTWLI